MFSDLVIEIALETIVKGDATEKVAYLQYVHGGAFTAHTYEINKPRTDLTFFLSDAARKPSETEEFVDEGKGCPPGARLYRLTSPQGLFSTSKGAVEEPLERGEALFGMAADLKEIEDAALKNADRRRWRARCRTQRDRRH